MAKPSKNTSTTPAVAAKAKTQTLGEFKAWLSGVEEMQPENWAPDLTQWRRIRERIENIVEGRFKSGGAGPSDDNEDPAPRVLRAAGPSAFAGAGPMMPQPMAPTPPPFMNTSDVAGARISTPNVDTSKQPYASSLE